MKKLSLLLISSMALVVAAACNTDTDADDSSGSQVSVPVESVASQENQASESAEIVESEEAVEEEYQLQVFQIGEPINNAGYIITVNDVYYTDERLGTIEADRVLVVEYSFENTTGSPHRVGADLRVYVGDEWMDQYPLENSLDQLASGESGDNFVNTFEVIDGEDPELIFQPNNPSVSEAYEIEFDTE